MMVISLFRITVTAALLTAIAAGISTLVGWLVFQFFGAVTMVFLYTTLNLLLVLGFAGMVIGSLAASRESEFPVSLAIAASTVFIAVVMLVSSAFTFEDILRPLALIILPVAAVRAWREKARRSHIAA